MLKELIKYLKNKYDNRPGKHLPGRTARQDVPIGTLTVNAPVNEPDEAPSGLTGIPDWTILFFLFVLDDGTKNYVKLTMDKDYMSQPDAFQKIMLRTARHYRVVEKHAIVHVQLLTYDQYRQGVQSCPDKTPIELTV